MKHVVYRLMFKAGVHFGAGMLNDSEYTFAADVLFSAMYIEALKQGCADELYHAVKEGGLRFSDALPYAAGKYMIPKPMPYVEAERNGDMALNKEYRKLEYIPMDQVEAYRTRTLKVEDNPMREFGSFERQVMANVRREENTLPFYVGTYHYAEGNGLYVIVGYEEDAEVGLAEELLQAVGYSGIGGKKASGLGRFTVEKGNLPITLHKGTGRKMLLSVALPREEELTDAMVNAYYLLQKRSGFVSPMRETGELYKKKDLYVFKAGSTFEEEFEGDIYDVAQDGKQSVYRYAKPLFMEV